MSLDNKLITPKQVSAFLKKTDVRIIKKHNKSTKEHTFNSSEDYYGMPNHPGTPIDKVVSFGYGNSAVDEKRKVYEAFLQNKQIKKKRSPNSIVQINTLEAKKDFKMKKFQNIESKVKASLK